MDAGSRPELLVVEASLRAFDKRKLIVVPGWRYKLMMGFLKLVPAPLIRRGSIVVGSPKRAPFTKGDRPQTAMARPT